MNKTVLWFGGFFMGMGVGFLLHRNPNPTIVKHDGAIYIQFDGKDYAKINSVTIVEGLK